MKYISLVPHSVHSGKNRGPSLRMRSLWKTKWGQNKLGSWGQNKLGRVYRFHFLKSVDATLILLRKKLRIVPDLLQRFSNSDYRPSSDVEDYFGDGFTVLPSACFAFRRARCCAISSLRWYFVALAPRYLSVTNSSNVDMRLS